MAGGVTAEVQTVKLISKLLVINFVLKLYALKNVFDLTKSILTLNCNAKRNTAKTNI